MSLWHLPHLHCPLVVVSNDIPVAPPPPPLPPGVTIESSQDAVTTANGTQTEQHATENGLNKDNACQICNGTVEISSPKEEEKDPCQVITPQCEEIEAWRNVMIVAAIFTLIFNIFPHVVSISDTGLLYHIDYTEFYSD